MTIADRLDEESAHRPVALLYHDGRRWRLEARSRGQRLGWRSPETGPLATPNLEEPGLAASLERIASELGTRALHVETLAGLPVRTLADRASSQPTLLSTHDFALFCARPNLLEEPAGRFCGFSTDDARCTRCLRATVPVSDSFQGERRREAARLARELAALVHPSPFALRETARHWPGLDPDRQVVVAPAVRSRAAPSRRAVWPPRRVAFVGQAFRHKGILEFEQLVTSLGGDVGNFSWAVAGDGDPVVLARLARRGVAILGGYAPGRLPELLAGAEVDLALLCSRFPETHSLVLDECLRAGVPVLAAPVGALPERVAASGAGWLAPPGPLAPALARRLEEVRADAGAVARLAPVAPSTPEEAAREHLALYARLGLVDRPPGDP